MMYASHSESRAPLSAHPSFSILPPPPPLPPRLHRAYKDNNRTCDNKWASYYLGLPPPTKEAQSQKIESFVASGTHLLFYPCIFFLPCSPIHSRSGPSYLRLAAAFFRFSGTIAGRGITRARTFFLLRMRKMYPQRERERWKRERERDERERGRGRGEMKEMKGREMKEMKERERIAICRDVHPKS